MSPRRQQSVVRFCTLLCVCAAAPWLAKSQITTDTQLLKQHQDDEGGASARRHVAWATEARLDGWSGQSVRPRDSWGMLWHFATSPHHTLEYEARESNKPPQAPRTGGGSIHDGFRVCGSPEWNRSADSLSPEGLDATFQDCSFSRTLTYSENYSFPFPNSSHTTSPRPTSEGPTASGRAFPSPVGVGILVDWIYESIDQTEYHIDLSQHLRKIYVFARGGARPRI